MFEELDLVYQPSRDVAADVQHYMDAFGAEFVFAVERFGTRVAMVRLTPDSPGLLLAEHLHGDQAILMSACPTSSSRFSRSRSVAATSAVASRCRRDRHSAAHPGTPAPGDLRGDPGRLTGRSLAGRRDF